MVAVCDVGLEAHAQRRSAADHCQSQVAGVGSRRHENLLLQERIGNGVPPGGHAHLNGEGFQVNEALGADGSAGEFVGAEVIALAQILDADVDLGHHERALDGGS